MGEYVLRVTSDQAKEMPMVDLAFEILKAANTPFYYRDLMKEIANIKGLTEEETMNVIAQVYTEINIDGRFACVGTNLWGLKRWYPVEKADEAVPGGTKRPRIINDDDDLDDEEIFEDEEETFDAEREEGEDFDEIDSERDEFFEEEEESDEEIVDEEQEDEAELEEDAEEEEYMEDEDELDDK